MSGSRKISNSYQTIHTHLRSIRDIHHDDSLLEKLYVNVWEREFDSNAVASYAFNLPSVGFKKKNELFAIRAIESIELFSSHQCIDPIFLYGHIGHGKTTYLRYLTQVRTKNDDIIKKFSKTVYFCYLEYTLSDPECEFMRLRFESSIFALIFDKIFKDHSIELTYDVLSEIFNGERVQYELIIGKGGRTTTDEFYNFIIKKYEFNKLYFIQNITHWLLNKKRIKIVYILDNADRHISQFSSQGEIIKLFQTIKSCYIQIILTLRIANRGIQNNEFFCQHQPIPITLGLPDYGELIKKRLQHIFNHYKNELGSPIIVTGHGNSSQNITTDEIEEKIEMIYSLITDYEDVRHGLELLSNYITREYLDIMINLFSSAPLFEHPLTGEKINYYERVSQGKFYSLFIYSLMLRNNNTHKENDANIPIINIFNNGNASDTSKLIRFYILFHLHSETDNTFSVRDIINIFTRDYPVNDRCVINALEALSSKKCISVETPTQIEYENAVNAIQDNDSRIMISPRGKYHIELCKDIEYYEILALPRLIGLKPNMSERHNNLVRYLKSLEESEGKFIGNGRLRKIWSEDFYGSLKERVEAIFCN
jgi:hypothetical protein